MNAPVVLKIAMIALYRNKGRSLLTALTIATSSAMQSVDAAEGEAAPEA